MSRARLRDSGLVLLLTLVTATGPAATQAPPSARPELVLQSGQGLGMVGHLAFSDDGQLVASGGRGDNAVHLWDVVTGRQLRLFEAAAQGQKLNSGVTAVAFGGGRRYIAAGFTDDRVVIWDVASGRTLHDIGSPATVASPFPVGVIAVWFDRAGAQIYVAGVSPPGIRVFDVASGKEQNAVPGAPPPQYWRPQGMTAAGTIFSLDFSPKKNSGELETAIVLQENGGKKVTRRTIPGSPAAGRVAVATIDGRVLAASVSKGALAISDVTSGAAPRILAMPAAPPQATPFVALSPDGTRVALAAGKKLSVWQTGQSSPAYTREFDVPATLDMAAAIQAFDFSPDGRLLAVGTFGGTTIVVDSATGRETARFTASVSVPYSLGFSADGRRLYAGARTVWNFDAGRGEKLIAGTGLTVSALSGDGRVLATALPGAADVTVQDVTSSRPSVRLPGSSESDVGAIAVSRDGALVAVSYQPRTTADAAASGFGAAARPQPLTIWDAASGKALRTLPGGTGAILQFSPDGRQIAISTHQQPDPVVYDLASGNAVAQIGSAASPPGGDIAEFLRRQAGSGNKASAAAMIAEIQRARQQLQQSLTHQVGSIAYSSDGRQLAVAITDLAPLGTPTSGRSGTGRIELWDVGSGKKVGDIPGPSGGTDRLAYAPGGKVLVTSGYDNEIALWDPAAARQIRTLGRAATRVLSFAFSPDGRLLASAHADGGTRLWDTASGDPLATLLSLNDGRDWLAVTPDGLFDGSPEAWSRILWRFSGNTLDVAPVEVFFNEYYYPELLSELMSGKRPRAAADIATKDRRQAEIGIAVQAAAPDAEVSSRTVTARIHVANAPAGARDLRLFRNGALVKFWHGDALQGRASADFDVTVPVVAGQNRFTAYVFNRDNIKSTDATTSVVGAPSLNRRGIGYLVSVGIDEYENPDYNLRYAVADAKSFAADLKAQMEKLDRLARVDVMLMTDRTATKAAILGALRDLAARVQPEDEVLVFIASHGAAAGDRFYLIPSDLGYTGKRTDLDEKAVETILSHSISDQDLEAAFEPMNAGRLLFVIDACNSGQALEAEEKRRGPMNSRGLAQLAYEKGMYVLTAAQSYQAAQEVSELGHGLLTYALITEGLDSASADVEPKDGRVVAREWLDYATGRVPRLQLEKIAEARQAGRTLQFRTASRGDLPDDATQHPRVFYRRELDDAIWLIARPR